MVTTHVMLVRIASIANTAIQAEHAEYVPL
jgi:hypothetical protein